MARLVHLTLEANARRIIAGGISARSRAHSGDRGVYCMPVLASFTLTHQWIRELRRWKPGVLVAADVQLPDDEPVTMGRYNHEPVPTTAADAVGVIRDLPDPRGHEIFVPRAITAREVKRIRRVPQRIGWRYRPDAHGRRPCACPSCLPPGLPGVARLRRRFPIAPVPEPKAQLMAALAEATEPDAIVDLLGRLARGRRGAAEELAYLVDHPDADVRETLFYALESYRGDAAAVLRDRLAPEFDITEE